VFRGDEDTMITYRDMFNRLSQFSDEELSQTATVHLAKQDEFLAVERMAVAIGSDVLDEGHFVLDLDA
jgi:hypothetical protein